MSIKLYSSPLQGLTDYHFRNVFNKYFGGIDTFYAPYIRLNGTFEIKNSQKRDILPANNSVQKLIPQIMTKDAAEFLFVAKFVQQLNYDELNWNLGCPYPMVAKKGMGSGLIKYPEIIDAILHKVFNESAIQVSIKMRLGYEKNDEIFNVLPVLEKYPIKNIAIHPRIGKQLYKGNVDLDLFQRCIEHTNHEVHYNGDINTIDDFFVLKNRFPTINNWLIGRGLISDSFLPQMIKNNSSAYPENRFEIFSKFHDTLLEEYSKVLSGDNHIIMKMTQLWEYFANSFSNPHKTLKKIKKSKSLIDYENAIKEILN